MRNSLLVFLVLSACGDNDGGDQTPPEVSSITPADGASGVWLHEPIRITFSEPIDAGSIAGATLSSAGADIPATVTAGESELVVIAGDAAAIIGELRLRLDGRITDLAGNALVETGATWTLSPWTRDERTGEAPSIAIDSAGTILLARNTSAPPRRVIASRYENGAWTDLGDELGERDAALPSISFDANGAPFLVWSEFGSGVGTPTTPSVKAARWNGAGWDPVASPGDGAFAVLARPTDGDPMVAFASPTNNVIHVRILDGDVWRDLAPAGFDIAVNGTLIGIPQLAAPMPAMPVIAFAETGVASSAPQLRIARWNNAWSESPAIALGTPPSNGLLRVSIAARGPDVLVGYDTYDGSYGVHAVLVNATTTRNLGGQLDIDPSSDAQAPAVALDADGTPIVVWRELIDGNYRGVAARWNGNTWDLLGGHVWNDDPARPIVRPFMALLRDRVPVIAWGESTGDQNAMPLVRVARWNGPRDAVLPAGSRASIAGCAFDGTATTLSATGCFTISNGRATAHAGLVPFDLVSELWSDGALKRRWIGLPDGMMMNTGSSGNTGGAWDAPMGTMLVKEFAIETTPGVASSRRVMETRFLLKTAGGTWDGYSFRWRPDGSDADLLPDAPSTYDWPTANGTTHTHSYPSRAQCARCHDDSNGPLLGVRSAQLARRFDYNGVIADQLAELANLGVVAAQQNITPFASPHDTSVSLETRVRGYLAANCSHCHNPTGERPTRDFRWETPLAQTMLCGADNEVVQGMPASSVIVQRISTRTNGMPPLATLQTDPLAISVVTRWITNETNCP